MTLFTWFREHPGLQAARGWLRANLWSAVGVSVAVVAGVYWWQAPSVLRKAPVQASVAQSLTSPRDALAQDVVEKRKTITDLEDKLHAAADKLDTAAKEASQAETAYKTGQDALRQDVAQLARLVHDSMKEKREAKPAAALATRGTPASAHAATTRHSAPAAPTFVPQAKLHILRHKTTGTTEELPPLHDPEAAYLAPGCMAEVVLATGGSTTSAPRGGLPILMQVADAFQCPAWLQGPGRNALPTAVPLQGCMLFGTAVGDMASSRAKTALDMLVCVMPDRRTFVRPVKGYVTDIDNMFGLVGQVETHTSAVMAKATLAALIQEASDAFGYAKSSVMIQAGNTTSQGVQGGMDRIATFYLQQAQQLLPTLPIDALKRGRAVMQEGVVLEGFPTTIHVSRGGE